MRKILLTVSAMFTFAASLLIVHFGSQAAQIIEVRWQDPINISNSATSSTYPSIVADDYGNVHVFWGEDFQGEPVNIAQPQEKSNAIMYSRWNGITWSEPIDIFYSQGSTGFNHPSAAISSDGRLYLAWQAFEGIYFSSVPLQQASTVKAWQPPELVATVRGDGPNIFSAPNGDLDMVYTAWEDAQSGGRNGNVFYSKLHGDERLWTEPIQLSSIPEGADVQASHPKVLLDDNDMLHVVWFEAESPDWVGSSVHYTHSTDDGFSWLDPVEIGRRTGDERWSSQPQIFQGTHTDLHITWVCGDNAHRCHRWSTDGGATWSATVREFGDFVSLAGWDAWAIDSAGTLYWILQLRYPSAIYYSYWNGSDWSELQLIHNGFLHDGHYPEAVVSDGNQINLVLVKQDQKEIYYIQGITNAPAASPMPTPKEPERPAADPTATPLLSSLSQGPTPVPTLSSEQIPPANPNSRSSFLIYSSLPVVGFILLIIIWKKWGAR
jgi:hypothetical protein